MEYLATRRRLALLVGGLALAGAAFLGTAGTARADYGTGSAYQVEISSNPGGFGFWLWAQLDPGGTSGDYQETDCLHLGGGHATDTAAHDAGSVSGWSVSPSGVLTMQGVNIIANLATVDIQVDAPADGYGHASTMTMTVTSEVFPFFPLDVPLTFPAEVQLAP